MVNLKVNQSAKDYIIRLKKDFGYSTYSETIDKVSEFFYRNKVAPKVLSFFHSIIPAITCANPP